MYGWLNRVAKLECEKSKKGKRQKTVLVAVDSLGNVGERTAKQYTKYKEKHPHEYNLHDWCFFLYDEYYSVHDKIMPHSLVRDAGMMKRILQAAGNPYILYWLIRWACENVDDLSIFMLNSNWLTTWLQQLSVKSEIAAHAQYLKQWIKEPEQRRIFDHLCTLVENDNDEARVLLKGLVDKWQIAL